MADSATIGPQPGHRVPAELPAGPIVDRRVPCGAVGRVLLVASTDLHVDLFKPIAAAFSARGWQVAIGSLDPWYGTGVEQSAQEANLAVVALAGHSAGNQKRRTHRSFYERPVPRIWADVLAAREPIRRSISTWGPDAVVVGNDRGLIEKVVLEEAGEHRLRVLVQDGHLGAPRDREDGVRTRLMRRLRRTASQILVRAGYSVLAASAYGAGPTDLICASGPAGARILEHVAGPRTIVRITGQPRYDALAMASSDPVRVARRQDTPGWEPRRVLWFPTPFAASGLGKGRDATQRQMIVELGLALPMTHRLIVKLHPRDDPASILAAAESAGDRIQVQRDSVADALEDATAAIIGISSVAEEAALLGVPVLVPGRRLHDERIADLLPPEHAYPRFEDAAGAARLIGELASPARRASLVQAQRAAIADRLDIDLVGRAASAVADAAIDAHAERCELQRSKSTSDRRWSPQ